MAMNGQAEGGLDEFGTSMHQQWLSSFGDNMTTKQHPNGASTSLINPQPPLGSVRTRRAPPQGRGHRHAHSTFHQVATGRKSPSAPTTITSDQAYSGALSRSPTNNNAYPLRRSKISVRGGTFRPGATHTHEAASSNSLPGSSGFFPFSHHAHHTYIDTTLDGTNWDQNVTDSPHFVLDPSQQYPELPLQRNAPSIRVTTDLSGIQDFSAQPQDVYNYSAASSDASLPPNEFLYNSYSPGRLRPVYPHFMPQDSEIAMQTPVSPVSAHQTPHEDPMIMSEHQPQGRKRSHSVMSDGHLAQNIAQNLSAMANGLADHQHEQQQIQQYDQPHEQQQDHPYHHEQNHQQDQQQDHLQLDHQQQNGRSQSVISGGAGSQGDGEDYSPRGTRAFKRGDPPRNEANKYICDYAEECQGLTFDRKCEWSKHMDKHDRPYRCPHPSCAKLQGFTYSGGLLRHEREVHGKHGGPKSALMCPFTECKRHTGKGFTRKENLNEHLRRVHSGKEPLDSQSSALHHELTEAAAAAGAEDTQASRLSETATAVTEHDAFTMNSPVGLKRKRSLEGLGDMGYDGVENMQHELQRLQAENSRKEEIIRQMGEEAAMKDERLKFLEEAMARMQNGQQQAV